MWTFVIKKIITRCYYITYTIKRTNIYGTDCIFVIFHSPRVFRMDTSDEGSTILIFKGRKYIRNESRKEIFGVARFEAGRWLFSSSFFLYFLARSRCCIRLFILPRYFRVAASFRSSHAFPTRMCFARCMYIYGYAWLG